jgi:CheY-like chemotaxis protein
MEMSAGDISIVIGAATKLLWALIALYVVWKVRDALAAAVARLTGVQAFGVKLAFSGGAAMDAAVDLAAKHPEWDVKVPPAARRSALKYAQEHRAAFEGAEILWVDDVPSNNRNEARMLRSFGAMITCAATTPEALRALGFGVAQARPFQLIISDISRSLPRENTKAGLEMLPELRAANFLQPVIFYVGRPDASAPEPAGAFGLTGRPDELLRLVADALMRVRG